MARDAGRADRGISRFRGADARLLLAVCDGTVKETLYNQDLGRTIPTVYGNFAISAHWRKLNFTLTGDYQTGAYVHSFDRQFRFAKNIKDDAIPQTALEGTTQAKTWLNFTNFFVTRQSEGRQTVMPGKVRRAAMSCKE